MPPPPSPPSPSLPPTTPDQPRTLTDPATIRAVAHPVRIALIEILALHQPLTATEAGELIGQTPTTCSFHLRMLAKYGFVEEAGEAPGRRRPWRLKHVGFTTADQDDQDPATTAAAAALGAVLWDTWLARLSAFRARRHGLDATAERLVNGHENLVFVTPDEADHLVQDIQAVINRHRDRLTDRTRRPEGSMPMEMLLFTYPLDLPALDAKATE